MKRYFLYLSKYLYNIIGSGVHDFNSLNIVVKKKILSRCNNCFKNKRSSLISVCQCMCKKCFNASSINEKKLFICIGGIVKRKPLLEYERLMTKRNIFIGEYVFNSCLNNE